MMRGMSLTTSEVLDASTELQTPVMMSKVPKLEKPHMAYVAMA